MSDYSSGDFFEQIRDALLTAVPDKYADFGGYAHSYGLKVTFGAKERSKEHYEVQLVRGKKQGTIELEIGFHAEHSKPERNDAVLERLAKHETKWRKKLGKEPVMGDFIGNDRWRRISETWDKYDFRDPEVAFEIADRLAEYIEAFEPLFDA